MTEAGCDPLEAVRETEAAILPSLDAHLRESAGNDSAVLAALRNWSEDAADASGLDAVQRAAARQANVLTNGVRYRAALGRDPPEPLRETPVVPFRSLGLPADVADALYELGATLNARGDADADLLGTRYAEVIDEEERRARGQFYTPATVADVVARWALGREEAAGERPARVLDPAAGTGTFQLAAFDHLRERHPNASDESLLSRLVAVDVDDVALHLAALRLSAHTGGGSVDALDRRRGSFFDLEPDEDVAPVDAVVGNPPFVRAGRLAPDRDHFRDHLAAFGPGDVPGRAEDESPYVDGDRALSRRCDASVYFLTHATRFLRPGGRLGMVLPAKWLESDYGVGFRRFLADQYRVHAVVGFGARTFDALVDTVLLLAERRERPAVGRDAGEDATVGFVRLDGPIEAGAVLDVLGDGPTVSPGEPARRGGRSRLVRRSQATFATARQCSPYLRAPEALLPLLDHPGFVPLGDLAAVSRGVTTGANRFFLVDRPDRERWGIDGRFLRPALRSMRGLDARTLSAEHLDRSILDVHGFLADRGVLGERDADPNECAKRSLAEAGFDGLVDYVEHAEAEGWHRGRTCQARRVWFDLGELPTPDAFVPKLLRERVFAIRNRAGAVPSNAIDCLSVRDGVDPEVLLGVLDSSLCQALMEVWGRDEAGLLQLMTYETRTLPVPDVQGFSPEAAAAIREAARALTAGGGRPDADDQAVLDAAVLDAAGVDLGGSEVRRLRDELLHRRVDDGDRVEAPVP